MTKYEEKFKNLSRYAPTASQDEETLTRKFLEGLRPTIGRIVATRDLYTVRKIAEIAKGMEYIDERNLMELKLKKMKTESTFGG